MEVVLQDDTQTFPNRYKSLFREVAKTCHPRVVMSFGCSTGEEINTLLCVFPKSHIVGLDINDQVLSVCKERFKGNKRVTIERSNDTNAKWNNQIDLELYKPTI